MRRQQARVCAVESSSEGNRCRRYSAVACAKHNQAHKGYVRQDDELESETFASTVGARAPKMSRSGSQQQQQQFA